MAQIKNEAAYRAALKRIDELLPMVNDETPTDDRNYLELDMISDMVEEYEDVYYPIGKPCEPSLKIGREISKKLNIDPAIVLGV